MSRPDFVTNLDILRWSSFIESDPHTPREILDSPIVREVCYAGLWLVEALGKLNCPDSILVRIQWTAGKMSYGRDPWDIHQMILQKYKDNTLVFESDDSELLN